MVMAILTREPVALEQYREGIAAPLAGIVRQALEKGRENRFSSAGELAGRLRSVLSEPADGKPRPARRPEKAEAKRGTPPAASGEETVPYGEGYANGPATEVVRKLPRGYVALVGLSFVGFHLVFLYQSFLACGGLGAAGLPHRLVPALRGDVPHRPGR